jgi:hypothetical protein
MIQVQTKAPTRDLPRSRVPEAVPEKAVLGRMGKETRQLTMLPAGTQGRRPRLVSTMLMGSASFGSASMYVAPLRDFSGNSRSATDLDIGEPLAEARVLRTLAPTVSNAASGTAGD